ncbi:putative transposable element [Trichonephila clavipes]|nr:putative transposable element [Trichonephila clavipes]
MVQNFDALLQSPRVAEYCENPLTRAIDDGPQVTRATPELAYPSANFHTPLLEELRASTGLTRSSPCIRQIFSGTSDEAHFWLNGYVNKPNCRIWSEANPQEYVETPLHPEKLTVWCNLWAGGILLQKR